MAADDDCATVLEILESSQALETRLRSTLAENQVKILEAEEAILVQEQLFGRQGSTASGEATNCRVWKMDVCYTD